MVLSLNRSDVPYGNGNRISTFREDEETHRRIAPIEEFIVIETDNISSGNSYSFDFSVYESPLQLLSFHISNRQQRGGRVEIKINFLAGRETKTISDFSLGVSQFPYIFAPVLILPAYQMVISPNYQIERGTIIAKQASIVYPDKVSERANNEQLER